MAEKTNATVVALFDKYVEMTDDEVRTVKTTHARKKLMRRYQAAIDDAELQISELTMQLNSMLDRIRHDATIGVDRFDVNERIRIVTRIREYEDAAKFLRADYEVMFAEQVA